MRTPELFLRRSIAALTFAVAVTAAACGGASDAPTTPNNPGGEQPGPVTPQVVTTLTATVVSSSSIRVSFQSRTGETSYNVERAEGPTGTFASLRVVPAPATASTLTFTDDNLKASTLYRYRVKALVGTTSSDASGEVSATTLSVPNSGPGAADVTNDITTNRTFYTDTTYTLKGFIHVTNGATLTIQPGTVIKGDFNTVGSALFIMRGARIIANGTATAPILFTSSRPNGQRQPGDWGGIVIVGNAPTNRSGSIALDATGSDGSTVVGGRNYQVLYSGGNATSDNSGSMTYVRVEFAGHAPAADNERGAFTFAAVGSGTRVSYLQSMGALDDAFSFFGGALDGDHLIAYETGDDMFDMTEGFSGRLQFLIGLNTLPLTPRAGAGTTSADITGIESDGCVGSGCDAGFNQQPLTLPLVANFSLVGCGNGSSCGGTVGGVGLSLRRGTGGYFINGVVTRFPTAGASIRDLETFERGENASTPSLATSNLLLRNIYFAEYGTNVFQQGLTAPSNQFSLDLTPNGLTAGIAISQSLFTSIPTPLTVPLNVGALDWTPPAGAQSSGGGMTSFSGRILAKAGSFVTPTPYIGAADPTGVKWWGGWSVYARN